MFMRPTDFAPQFTYNRALGETAKEPSIFDKFTDALTKAAPAYAQYKLTKLNLDRAKKGLPPIDSAAVAPTVRVQAEVDPALKRALYIGGGIIAAAAIVAALRR